MSARAQVGREHDSGGAWGKVSVNPGANGTPVHATLQMWVEPEGEPPARLRTVTLQNGLTLFESHLSLWGSEIERMGAGRWTYVRYQSDRPQRCEIDEPRLKREFGDLYGGKQRLLIPVETSAGWFAPAVADAAAPEPAAAAAGAPTGRAASTAGAPAGPAAAPSGDVVTAAETPPLGLVADLAQLAQLREAGSLSDTEFAAAKARLLAQGPPG